jgi:hypothetical protein
LHDNSQNATIALVRSPVTVTLLEKTGLPVEVGTVEFYRLPITKPDDYKCMPRGVLTFEQVKQIATELGRGKTSGDIGDLEWQKGT